MYKHVYSGCRPSTHASLLGLGLPAIQVELYRWGRAEEGDTEEQRCWNTICEFQLTPAYCDQIVSILHRYLLLSVAQFWKFSKIMS